MFKVKYQTPNNITLKMKFIKNIHQKGKKIGTCITNESNRKQTNELLRQLPTHNKESYNREQSLQDSYPSTTTGPEQKRTESRRLTHGSRNNIAR